MQQFADCLVVRRAAFAAAVLVAAAWSAQAATFGFDNLSANSLANALAGESQLHVEVSESGLGQVAFTFQNQGPAPSSITDIYFDAPPVMAISQLSGSDGVNFESGATPHNLPSANDATPRFESTPGFSAESTPPVQLNGINPGEWLSILFDLHSGFAFNDILRLLEEGDLRIGIHVQGFADGGSESFVSGVPPQAVPDAANTLLLLALALGTLGLSWKRVVRS